MSILQPVKEAVRWSLGFPARRALRLGRPVNVEGIRLCMNPEDRYAIRLTHWSRKGDSLLRRVRETIARYPECLLMDVGANYGLYAISGALVQRGIGRTVAVEPSPRTRRYLRKNVQLNGVSHKIAVADVALGEVECEQHIFTNGFSGGDSLAEATTTIPGCHPAADLGAVRVVRGDTLLDELQLSVEQTLVLKIDVQGYEVQVLRGLRQHLALHPRVICFCEVSPALMRLIGMDPLDMWRALPEGSEVRVSGASKVLCLGSFSRLVQDLQARNDCVDLEIRREVTELR